jgi:hypothetical protein
MNPTDTYQPFTFGQCKLGSRLTPLKFASFQEAFALPTTDVKYVPDDDETAIPKFTPMLGDDGDLILNLER